MAEEIEDPLVPTPEPITPPVVETPTVESVAPSTEVSPAVTAPPAVAAPVETPTVETEPGAFVEKRLEGLLSKDNAYMAQARTRAKQASEQRGLLNSSIATTAGESAAISAALPIASQDAAFSAQHFLQKLDTESKERIAHMNVQSHDRDRAMSAAAVYEGQYADMFRVISTAPDIPSAQRDKFLTHIAAIRDSTLNLVEQFYNVDLTWASPSV